VLSVVANENELERARLAADERRLVAAAVKGSSEAFEGLYRLHAGKVYGLCLRMTGKRETAEDCTQEAFVQAWRSLPRFEARSSFGTWMHRIAVNAVLANGRRRTERVGTDASVEDGLMLTLEDGEVGDTGDGLDVEAAIASLPPGARQVLVLAGVYGYSHEETAAMLGLAVGTCKAQLHRARQLLGQRLGTEEGSR
jgi:RNA polymerase sigma-70 factor (ECF subfamily)